MHAAAASHHFLARGALLSAVGRLEVLSPLAVLSRGYAVCWAEDRQSVLRDASAVTTGDRIHVTLARGALECLVQQTSVASDAEPRAAASDEQRPIR